MLALGLLSGGLDSSLAVKLVLDQGIDVVAVKFTSPFCQCDSGGCSHAANLAQELNIRLITVPKGQEYLDIVREPRFGRGSGMNPCIDCRVFILKKAKAMAEEMGAGFIFTGEVVGQRPMSQHRRTLDLIEKEAGLEGKVVRPLCAKLLPETEAERMGWIDRRALMGIAGRGRKPQIELASELGIADYPCPAGGCLLTSKELAARLRDHLDNHPDRLTGHDVSLLKVGRHFRMGGRKIIIGRNKTENDRLEALGRDDMTLIRPSSVPGPICLVEGSELVGLDAVAPLVARYSDHEGRAVSMVARSINGAVTLEASPAMDNEVDLYRIGATVAPLIRSSGY